MTWADNTHADRVAFFNFHGDELSQAVAEWQEATRKLASVFADCAAFENARMTAERAAEEITDTASALLPSELQEYLGL